jgi:hypothetical protein
MSLYQGNADFFANLLIFPELFFLSLNKLGLEDGF